MRSLWNRTQWVLHLLLASVVLLSANQAGATIIGLGDGTYDATLTCTFADCAPAGPLGPFAGTLTVVGNDVTAWSFAFPATVLGFAEVFSGNPVETIDMFSGNESAGGFGLAAAVDELVLRTGSGSQTWDIFQNGVSVIHGAWTAVPQDTPSRVPEPASAVLFLFGLATLGICFRFSMRRSRKAPIASYAT